MNADDREDFDQGAHEAVVALMATFDPACVVSRVVVLVETIGATDDDSGMWTGCSPGMAQWETMGFLKYALALEEADAVRRALED